MEDCLLCKLQGALIARLPGQDIYEIECERCGEFQIEGILPMIWKTTRVEEDKRLISYLPAYIRCENRGKETPILQSESWKDCAQKAREVSVSQKRFLFLKFLSERDHGLGDEVKVTWDIDYPRAGARSSDELFEMARYLKKLGYIEYPNIYRDDVTLLKLTPEGQEFLETHAGQGDILGQIEKRKESEGNILVRDSSHHPLKVFLCHSSGDKQRVRQLYRKLKANSLDPWLDEEKILPGQDWEQEILKAVRDSAVVLVCLSPQAITKRGYVQKEIVRALDEAKKQPEGTIFIVPVKLEECDIPNRLLRWQWVNLFEDTGYEKLMHSLQTCANELES